MNTKLNDPQSCGVSKNVDSCKNTKSKTNQNPTSPNAENESSLNIHIKYLFLDDHFLPTSKEFLKMHNLILAFLMIFFTSCVQELTVVGETAAMDRKGIVHVVDCRDKSIYEKIEINLASHSACKHLKGGSNE